MGVVWMEKEEAGERGRGWLSFLLGSVVSKIGEGWAKIALDLPNKQGEKQVNWGVSVPKETRMLSKMLTHSSEAVTA